MGYTTVGGSSSTEVALDMSAGGLFDQVITFQEVEFLDFFEGQEFLNVITSIGRLSLNTTGIQTVDGAVDGFVDGSYYQQIVEWPPQSNVIHGSSPVLNLSPLDGLVGGSREWWGLGGGEPPSIDGIFGQTLRTLLSDDQPLSIYGTDFDDVLIGKSMDDLIESGGGDNLLMGGGGNDTLVAGEGDNTLDGGTGDDVLISGPAGRDVLIGGPGADRFVITDGGTAVIEDFEVGTDVLDLGWLSMPAANVAAALSAATVQGGALHVDLGAFGRIELVGITPLDVAGMDVLLSEPITGIFRFGSFEEDPAWPFFNYGVGAPGGLLVTDGAVFPMNAVVRSASMNIGLFEGGEGEVVVTGAGSRIDMTGAGHPEVLLGIGVGALGGSGQLYVEDGGRLTMTDPTPGASAFVHVGDDPGSIGAVEVSGGGSFDMTAGNIYYVVGREGGLGNLWLWDGGSSRLLGTDSDGAVHMEVGYRPGAGGEASEGYLVLSSGAALDMDGGRFAWLNVGAQGSTATVLLDDADVFLTAGETAGMRVGSRFGGDAGGTGQVIVQNTAHILMDGGQNADLFIGGVEGSLGEVRVLSGGRIDTGGTGNLRVGAPPFETEGGGLGFLRIDGEGSEVVGLRQGDIGRDGGQGEVTVSDTGWLRFGTPDTASDARLRIGEGAGGEGLLFIDTGLVSLEAGNGGFEPGLSVGRDGGSGAVTIFGDPGIGLGQGLFVIGGGTSEVASTEIGRGAGSEGVVLVDGGLLWQQNVGSSFGTRDLGEVLDLPGEGGDALLRIGRDGGFGLLQASGGAEVINIGTDATRTGIGVGGEGEFVLYDARFENRSEAGQAALELGDWGDGDGRMYIEEGAEVLIEGVTAAFANIGRLEGSTGVLFLRDASSLELRATEGDAYMGVARDAGEGVVWMHGGSTLRLESGSADHGAQLDIGRNSETGGSVAINSGSLLQIEGVGFANLVVGSEGGTGSFLVDDARVEMTGEDTNIRIGTRWSHTEDGGGDGTVTLRNGAELEMAPAPGSGGMRIGGDGGTGRLDMLTGAQMTMGGSAILVGVSHAEQTPGGTGTLLLVGEGTSLSGARGLDIGGHGTTGNVAVVEGAQMMLGGAGLDGWSWLELGRGDGSLGMLTVDRGLVVQQGSDGFRPGGEGGWTPYTVIGRDGGTGSMFLAGDRATDPGAEHGYVQFGGADAPSSTLDIGRGAGASGNVTVVGAVFGTRNDGSGIDSAPPIAPVDLPGPGGAAALRLGIEGATGQLVTEDNAHVLVQSGSDGSAALVIGNTGGSGTATLDGGRLDILSAGDRSLLAVGIDEGSLGRLTLDGTAATLRGGGSGTQVAGRDVLVTAGFGGGDGHILVTGGASLDLLAEDEAQVALLELGMGGIGGLRIEGQDSRVTLSAAETRVNMATGEEGGTASLEIADGGRLEAGGALVAGREEATHGGRSIALDGGTLEADSLTMWSGTLMGAGLLHDIDSANGFAQLVDSLVQVGTALVDGQEVAGRGNLNVTGDVAITGGTLAFTRLVGAGPDQLLIDGGLTVDGTTLAIDWHGAAPAPDSLSEYLLVRASGGIALEDVGLDADLGGAPVVTELRAGGTELWLLAGDGEPAGPDPDPDPQPPPPPPPQPQPQPQPQPEPQPEPEPEPEPEEPPANTPAQIAGDSSGAVAEGDPERQVAAGVLTVTDPDPGEDRFQAPDPAALQGSFGAFAFDPVSGVWSYTLDNEADAVRALDLDEEVTDSLTVTSLDGTATETITVTVTGAGLPTVAVGGTIVDRAGNELVGTVLTFTPDPDDAAGAEAVVETDAEGRFVFDLAPGTAGQLDATRPYGPGDPAITTGSALEALRMAVGLNPSWGPAGPMDFIAADFNGDGAVTSADALDILRVAVGLEADHAPRWMFIDPETDLGAIGAANTGIDTGRTIEPAMADALDFGLTGILVGHVQEYV